MRLGIIFTNDWELYGDGSGDFWDVQYKPMNELLELFDDNDVKMSIMAEVGQQISFKSIAKSNNEVMNICTAWEDLVKRAVKSNHDVQLHFHPQWIGAKYDGKWHLRNENWAIGKLSENEIKHIISIGKNYLEQLLVPVKSDYKCNCFRAGAYYIEPSELVLKVLKEYDFICDTSVTKGMVANGYFDYTSAHSNVRPYFIDSDVKRESRSEKKLIEFPIYSKFSLESRILKKFIPKLYSKFWNRILIPKDEIDWSIKRDKLKNVRYPKENRFYKTNQKKDLSFYFKQILSVDAQQLDYDYIFPTEFLSILKNIYNEFDLKPFINTDIIIPIVASGHIKDIPNLTNLEKIIKMIKTELSDKVVFWTLSEAVNYFYTNQKLFTNK